MPAYRQIMEQIRLQIASGVLQADDEMPSTRALSVTLSLNPMTISKAYGLLERDGVLERRRGQTLVDLRQHPGEDIVHGLAEEWVSVEVALDVDAPRYAQLFLSTLGLA